MCAISNSNVCIVIMLFIDDLAMEMYSMSFKHCTFCKKNIELQWCADVKLTWKILIIYTATLDFHYVGKLLPSSFFHPLCLLRMLHLPFSQSFEIILNWTWSNNTEIMHMQHYYILHCIIEPKSHISYKCHHIYILNI